MVIVGMCHLQSDHRHHKPGCAEAALRSIGCHHGALNRVRLGQGSVLHCDDLFFVHHTEEQNACVGGSVLEVAVLQFTNQYRTRAAVALGAAFFCTFQFGVFAQVLKQCCGWIVQFGFYDFPTEQKSNLVTRGIHRR